MTVRHLGLRAQIVLSLAALLVVVFGFTAMALLWVLRASLNTQQRELAGAAAEMVVRGVASELEGETSEFRASRELERVLGRAGIVAIGLYDDEGEPVAQRSFDGDELDLRDLSPRRYRFYQTVRPAADGSGDEMVMVQPLRRGGSVVAVVSLGVSAEDLNRIARPLLIYLFTSGLLLLGFGYFALTRLIVRPLEELTRATERVAEGSLEVTVPVRGGREIASAAMAFNVMTRRLKDQKIKLERQLEELEQTAQELCATQDQLIRSARLASVGSLAAGVSHEVGNPISAIMGLAEVLSEGGLEPEEERDYIERIRRESERVNRIIRDLLEYARLRPEADEEEAGVISEAVDAAAGLLSPQKSFREIELTCSIEEDLPPVLPATDQLTQVLVNLLMNAADAMEGKGRVEVRAYHPEGGDRVMVEVTDSGPGVPDDDLERIFEPFYTTKEPGMGTGLGLALCEGIITRAGGVISAKNGERCGLTISLGLAIPDPE